MRSVLEPGDFHYPELTDFEVHIPKGGSSNALTECFITWQVGQGQLKTRGVHANQVFAGINASLRMLNMIMQQQAEGAVESKPLAQPE